MTDFVKIVIRIASAVVGFRVTTIPVGAVEDVVVAVGVVEATAMTDTAAAFQSKKLSLEKNKTDYFC